MSETLKREKNMKTKILIMVLILSIQGLFADYAKWLKEHPNPKIISQDGQNYNTIDDFGNYYALLIWVEDYTYLKHLKTPKHDVEDIAKILKERYFFDKKNIHILPNPKNGDDIIFELDKLKNMLTEKDNLLIYYAGHGSAENNETAYWTLTDGKNINITRAGSISLNEAITHTLKNMKCKHIIVVTDSCYSGVLTRDGNQGSFGAISKNEMNYYNILYNIQSRTVLTSGGNEPVQDSDTLNPNHSVFANSFLRVLKNNKNSIFSFNEKFKDIRKYVFLNATQKPTYEGLRFSNHQIGGDFIFIDRKSVYAHKDRNVSEPKRDRTSSFISPKKPKVDNRIDTILVWSLGIVSLLLLMVSIIHFRTRKKIPISHNGEITGVNKDNIVPLGESVVPPVVVPPKPIKDNIKGAVTMAKLTYQNQPFTKKYTWEEAKEYAKNLRLGGFDDWRLPTLRELRALGNIELYDGEDDALWNEWYQNNKENALVNSKGEKHFMHEKLVENMPKESIFWTIESKDENDVYMVSFNLGCNYVDDHAFKYYVLCVRDNK